MNKLDNIFLYCCLSSIAITGIALVTNGLLFHYEVINFPSELLDQWMFFAAMMLYVLGFIIQRHYPRLGMLAKTIGMVFLVLFMMLIIEVGAFTTPFALHDGTIHHLDSIVNFNILKIVTTVHHYPWLVKSSYFFYHLLYAVIIIVPLILATLKDETKVYQYILAYLVAAIIGFIVYYFYPTADPAGVLSSPYFPKTAHLVVQQFDLVHHYKSINEFRAGYVGLPSFHTIWAVIVAYCCYHRKILFYPVLLISLLIIASTFTTGWHFLLDDIAGIIVALASCYIAIKLIQSSVFQLKSAKNDDPCPGGT